MSKFLFCRDADVFHVRVSKPTNSIYGGFSDLSIIFVFFSFLFFFQINSSQHCWVFSLFNYLNRHCFSFDIFVQEMIR